MAHGVDLGFRSKLSPRLLLGPKLCSRWWESEGKGHSWGWISGFFVWRSLFIRRLSQVEIYWKVCPGSHPSSCSRYDCTKSNQGPPPWWLCGTLCWLLLTGPLILFKSVNMCWESSLLLTFLVVPSSCSSFPPPFALFASQIPKGHMLCLSPVLFHRQDEVYHNADQFDPDRWNDDFELHSKQTSSKFDFMSFGGGVYRCPVSAFFIWHILVSSLVSLFHSPICELSLLLSCCCSYPTPLSPAPFLLWLAFSLARSLSLHQQGKYFAIMEMTIYLAHILSKFQLRFAGNGPSPRLDAFVGVQQPTGPVHVVYSKKL